MPRSAGVYLFLTLLFALSLTAQSSQGSERVIKDLFKKIKKSKTIELNDYFQDYATCLFSDSHGFEVLARELKQLTSIPKAKLTASNAKPLSPGFLDLKKGESTKTELYLTTLFTLQNEIHIVTACYTKFGKWGWAKQRYCRIYDVAGLDQKIEPSRLETCKSLRPEYL